MIDHRDIVWLASYPKSGNTWVRLLFDAYFLGEQMDINEIITSIGDDHAGRHAIGGGEDVCKLPVDLQQLTRPMALLRLVLAFRSNRVSPDLPLLVKTHAPHMVANGIEQLPEMLTRSVIYLVRHPFDILPSFAKHMGVDLETGATYMQDRYRVLESKGAPKVADFIGSWDAHVRSYLDADTHNILIVKYEDLCADPAQAFTRMLQHAEVPVDPARVAQAVELTQLERLRKLEQAQGFHESSPHAKDQFFGQGGSRGRDQVPQRLKIRFRQRFRRIMRRLDYLDGNSEVAA